jgi:hypothetical protein
VILLPDPTGRLRDRLRSEVSQRSEQRFPAEAQVVQQCRPTRRCDAWPHGVGRLTDESNVYAPPEEPVAPEEGAEEPRVGEGPRGIGGWLLLPLLGLIVTPIRVGYSLVADYIPFFRESWPVLTDPNDLSYHPLWAPLIIYEVLGDAVLALTALLGLVLMFRRDRRLPKLMVALYSFNAIYIAVDTAVAAQIPALAGSDDFSASQDLIRAVVAAGIWIPYFLMSKRVKNTFVAAFLS